MNDLITQSAPDTEVALPIAPTFDAKGYVAAVFDPFKRQITKAKREAAKVEAYDITTTAGMSQAKALRAMFRDIRTGVESTRKERKAPIIESGKLLDARAAEITAEVEPYEDKYDREIKAEEDRKEAEKQRKLAEERARVEAIENRLANIRGVASRLASADTATIAKEIGQWTTLRLDPADYQEYLEDALTAVNTTLDQLNELWNVADAREIAARKAEADRTELARLREETAERERREADEKAQRDAADLQRRADEQANADAQARLIADLQAQLAAAQKAAEPAPAPEPPPMSQADIDLMADAPAPGGTEVQVSIDTSHDADDGVVTRDGKPVDPVPPAMAAAWRPTDEAILHGLARSFGIRPSAALKWLEDMDLPALRAVIGE